MTTSSPTPTAHPLAPDLVAIREFARLGDHDQQREARAAMALYDDICWRAAMVPLPERTARAILAREGEAAGLMRRYVAGQMAPAEFWNAFARVVELLDGELSEGLATSGAVTEALENVRRLREDVATAKLPPTLRQTVQGVLGLMDAEAMGLVNGRLAPEDFARVFEQGRRAVEDALAREPAAEATAARLHDLAARALATRAPEFLEGPIVRQLMRLTAAWEADEPIEAVWLDELEGLLDRAEAVRREQAAGGAPEASSAAELATADRVDAARKRVERANVPPFVAHTARELVEAMGAVEGLPAPEQGLGLDPEAELAGLERQIEDVLAFGRELMREETAALLHYQTIEGRASRRELAPLLRGPVEDELELLRGMLRRLHGGLYPLASFHADFEKEAQRLELLLAWQDVLESGRPA